MIIAAQSDAPLTIASPVADQGIPHKNPIDSQGNATTIASATASAAR
jgi:hypothetical protein